MQLPVGTNGGFGAIGGGDFLRRLRLGCGGLGEGDEPTEGTQIANDRVLEVRGLRLYLDNALVESELGEARLTPAEFELLKQKGMKAENALCVFNDPA
ncbi:MAG TPA: hypothetical protein PK472_13720, partial [Pseudomonadota bacterium]|nr:hypothetical protein [Pseudomonadota bacterium]